MAQFGGFAATSAAEIIAIYTEANPDSAGGGSVGGSASVTAEIADLVVDWPYGSNASVTDFDPATGSIFVGWISADDLEATEVDSNTVFALPSNLQTTTLVGVSPADLSPSNFTFLDVTAASEILGLIGEGTDETGGGDHGSGDHGGGMGHTHMHVSVTLAMAAGIIDGFMPDMGDVIEIEADVYAGNFAIFEEFGEALGQTVRIEIAQGGTTKQIVLTSFGLDDLSIGNFSVANEGVLNKISAALGSVVVTPGTGEGYTLSYDNDGSNYVEVKGTTDQGGSRFRSDSNADDIIGFDPTKDALDFGGTSVHGMIVTKSQASEIVIDSPWTDAAQIVQGITYQDVTIESFGVVGNEHLRQDLGGVVSWERGVGPRDADAVYVRSHEYGVHEVVEGFDPAIMKISFLYFGTRERLDFVDTHEGLVISSLPTGQSLSLTGVERADLVPGRVEFHHDQVMEDNLEDGFGFAQEDVTLVSRAELLTPQAPAGVGTDGTQTRQGDMTGNGGASDGSDAGPAETADETPGVIEVTWNWGAQEVISDFDAATDSFDFGALNADLLQVSEEGDDLRIDVLTNGGHSYTVLGLQAEDLSSDNLTAQSGSSLLLESSTFITQLSELGFDFG